MTIVTEEICFSYNLILNVKYLKYFTETLSFIARHHDKHSVHHPDHSTYLKTFQT